MLAIADCYYDDEYEWSDAVNGTYRALMRAMRDTGISGHVLIGDTVKDEELAGLAGQKVFFFYRTLTGKTLQASSNASGRSR